jgi:SAM-dependent methyltransferase
MEKCNYNHDLMAQIEKTNWWYRGKRDLFDRLLNGQQFMKALDVGCGVGSNIEIIQKYARTVIGVDNAQKAVDYCVQRGFNVIRGDIYSLSFDDNSFDLVVCSDVLEHVDDVNALSEISRVLQPGGTFLFSVPANQHLWNDNDDFSHHLRRYDKKRLRQILQKDFTILQLKFWNFSSYVPVFIIYQLQKLNKTKTVTKNLTRTPHALNTLLYSLISFENKLFQKISFPQGVSLVGIAIKR